jgi:hypothetical protein
MRIVRYGAMLQSFGLWLKNGTPGTVLQGKHHPAATLYGNGCIGLTAALPPFTGYNIEVPGLVNIQKNMDHQHSFNR